LLLFLSSGLINSMVSEVRKCRSTVVMQLYVGNLPYSATEAEVRALFEQCGTVLSIKLVMDRDTGQPKGFGFVEMEDAAAQAAMQKLNGADCGGRPMRVNEAHERGAGGRGGRGGDRGDRGGGGRPQRW
jgi:RNA recognition motif-containing protein